MWDQLDDFREKKPEDKDYQGSRRGHDALLRRDRCKGAPKQVAQETIGNQCRWIESRNVERIERPWSFTEYVSYAL